MRCAYAPYGILPITPKEQAWAARTAVQATHTAPPQPQGQTASLSSLAARNATFLLALILIGSPVAGLRPMRAARLRT